MRIIRPGIHPYGWPQELECDHCKALLEVERADCTYGKDSNQVGFYEFYCADCGKRNTISEWDD